MFGYRVAVGSWHLADTLACKVRCCKRICSKDMENLICELLVASKTSVSSPGTDCEKKQFSVAARVSIYVLYMTPRDVKISIQHVV